MSEEQLHAALARIEESLKRIEVHLAEQAEVLRQIALGLGIPP